MVDMILKDILLIAESNEWLPNFMELRDLLNLESSASVLMRLIEYFPYLAYLAGIFGWHIIIL